MLEWIRFSIVALLFGAGIITLFISLLGTFRLDYALDRLHSSAITDTLVLLLFTAGCIIASGINIISVKIIIVLFIQWCTSPLVSHMFVKAKIRTDDKLRFHCRLPDCSETATRPDNKEEQ